MQGLFKKMFPISPDSRNFNSAVYHSPAERRRDFDFETISLILDSVIRARSDSYTDFVKITGMINFASLHSCVYRGIFWESLIFSECGLCTGNMRVCAVHCTFVQAEE
jgi:hypothetical protein